MQPPQPFCRLTAVPEVAEWRDCRTPGRNVGYWSWLPGKVQGTVRAPHCRMEMQLSLWCRATLQHIACKEWGSWLRAGLGFGGIFAFGVSVPEPSPLPLR